MRQMTPDHIKNALNRGSEDVTAERVIQFEADVNIDALTPPAVDQFDRSSDRSFRAAPGSRPNAQRRVPSARAPALSGYTGPE